MYQTVEEVRERLELGLVPSGDYSDSAITSLIIKTEAIVNSYIGYDISYGEYTDSVFAIPNYEQGVTAQLKRRFVDEVFNMEIDYDYRQDNYVIPSGDWFVYEDAGYIETRQGSCPQWLFSDETVTKYKAIVTYTAGFVTIPSDFLEAFYMIMQKVVGDYKLQTGVNNYVAVSNKVKSYQTLNESMSFVDDKAFTEVGSEIISDSVRVILDKYALPKSGMGRFM